MVEENMHSKNVVLKQYFLCIGLGICIELQDLTTIHFFGHMFSHCTSVCLVMIDQKIYVKNDGSANLFSWGVGG